MKGIILSGGAGSRLYPLTRVASKQLQPVYDKPMIYYPLSTLMLAGIREVLLITTPEDIERFRSLLGDGANFGMTISYAIQDKPNGIAQAFLIGEQFIGGDAVTLILGDNIFYGEIGLEEVISEFQTGACVFGHRVADPERYGVVEFDEDGHAISIEEKPSIPKSHFAVPGLYVYDKQVVEIAKNMAPSARGELEITDVNREYLRNGTLRVQLFGRGVAWLDSGTHDSLLDASNFIATIEIRQGIKIACLEEIAFNRGYIGFKELNAALNAMPNSSYRTYLLSVIDQG